MDDNLETFLLGLLTVSLVLLNGFFVATEFAIVKVRSTRIKELAGSGNVSAQYTSDAITHLDAYLSATQLGITLASLGLGWVGEPLVAHRLVGPVFAYFGFAMQSTLVTTISYTLALALITFVHIVFGEQAPKWLAIQEAERTALWVARPMAIFYWLFKPFILVLNAASNGVVRMLGVNPEQHAHDLVHSEEELRIIITASGADHGGTLRETQAELLDNVFDFGRRLARQVMTHRTEILALDVDETLAENVRQAQDGERTRYPVIQGDIDTVIGFVHTKDLFARFQRDPQADMRAVVREILLVPDTIRGDLLLRQMQRKRQHMAVLVDEYGGTAGLVSITDLLEELVGEWPDEFEPEEEQWLTPIGDHAWSVDGRMALADLEEAIGHELSCDEACDTVGGYVFWAFGRIPEVGDSTDTDETQLRVLAMDGRRVSRVQITAAPLREVETAHNGNGK